MPVSAIVATPIISASCINLENKEKNIEEAKKWVSTLENQYSQYFNINEVNVFIQEYKKYSDAQIEQLSSGSITLSETIFNIQQKYNLVFKKIYDWLKYKNSSNNATDNNNNNNNNSNINPKPTPDLVNPEQPENPDEENNVQPNPKPDPEHNTENPNENGSETRNTGNNETHIPATRKSIAHKLLWGHWNILKASTTSAFSDIKNKAIAEIIRGIDFDLIGLTEVFNVEVAEVLVQHLNRYTNGDNYDFIVSDKLKGSYAGTNQAEHVAIIYKKDRLRPVAFNNGKIGDNYSQVFNNDEIGVSDVEYVRPPYGVKFEWFKDGIEDFTFVFDHFDSPGSTIKNSNDWSIGKSQGAQEVAEARQLPNVLNWFDSIDGKNEDIFFSGDTNIKTNNFIFAFENIINKGYISALEDSTKNASSLGTTSGRYSEAYDKIIYKTKWELENPFVYKLWSAILDPKIGSKLEELGFVNVPEGKSVSGIQSVKRISDHCPVGATISFNVYK